MQLTVGEIYDAVQALIRIEQSKRMIPQIAKFRLARMHDRLEPLYKAIETRHAALHQELGSEQFNEQKESLGWGIREGTDAHVAYLERWQVVRAEPVEVKISPITLESLGDDPKGLEVLDFKMLGKLVYSTHDVPEPVGNA